MERNLPESWRAAVLFCPYCASEPSKDDCPHCGGTRDLMGFMLLEAWTAGRDHVLKALRDVEAVRRLAVESVEGDIPSRASLKRKVGL